ncbi:MAG: tyrosine-protein phosphatase [Chitinophagaceae bacterium]
MMRRSHLNTLPSFPRRRESFLLVVVCIAACTIARAQEREVILQGTYNFRDIGGYPTKGGKKIKWEKLYRSAFLTGLTAEDLDILQSRKVARVIDFRGPKEIAFAPDKLPQGTQHIVLSAGSVNDGPDDWEDMANEMKTKTEDESEQGAYNYYRNVSSFADRYRPMFEQMLKLPQDSALVFHCVGGKDRTGIAAALIQYVLGVDYKDIMSDFELTNQYRARYNKEISELLVRKYGVSPDRAKLYGLAKAKFLQASFDALAKQYGSLDLFVKNGLGLDDSKIAKLKAMYLY